MSKNAGAFTNAVREDLKWGKTWNGEDAHVTTSNHCLDLFARAGSLRGAEKEVKQILISEAMVENRDIAMKLLFYIRDIRGGYGERDTFTEMFRFLGNVRPSAVHQNLWAVLEFGRAKDLYCLIGTVSEDYMWEFIKNQFELDLKNMEAGKSISLLAKWLATPDASSSTTKELGKLTAKKLGYNYKTMRKYKKKLRALRKYLDLPEAKMCAGQWDSIEYSKCASRFMLKNRKAIERHDKERYDQYIADVMSGREKMNAGTLMPHDIIQKVWNNDYTNDLEAMWKSLPDMNSGNALVICDTSGSMFWEESKGGGVYPGVVAFALAMYLAERNKGDFKNLFMTFSSCPKFVEIKGETLPLKFSTIQNADVGGSTNLEAAFELVLNTAIKGKMKSEDLPKTLIIISDMQINCVNGLAGDRMLFYDKMVKRFEEAGYKMPHVVFWNVNAQNATFHANLDSKGVSMVSGFSPNVMKQVLECIGKTPYELMMDIVNSERYKDITGGNDL